MSIHVGSQFVVLCFLSFFMLARKLRFTRPPLLTPLPLAFLIRAVVPLPYEQGRS